MRKASFLLLVVVFSLVLGGFVSAQEVTAGESAGRVINMVSKGMAPTLLFADEVAKHLGANDCVWIAIKYRDQHNGLIAAERVQAIAISCGDKVGVKVAEVDGNAHNTAIVLTPTADRQVGYVYANTCREIDRSQEIDWELVGAAGGISIEHESRQRVSCPATWHGQLDETTARIFSAEETAKMLVSLDASYQVFVTDGLVLVYRHWAAPAATAVVKEGSLVVVLTFGQPQPTRQTETRVSGEIDIEELLGIDLGKLGIKTEN